MKRFLSLRLLVVVNVVLALAVAGVTGLVIQHQTIRPSASGGVQGQPSATAEPDTPVDPQEEGPGAGDLQPDGSTADPEHSAAADDLYRKGSAAYDAWDLEGAKTLFEQAAEAYKTAGDEEGERLSQERLRYIANMPPKPQEFAPPAEGEESSTAPPIDICKNGPSTDPKNFCVIVTDEGQ